MVRMLRIPSTTTPTQERVRQARRSLLLLFGVLGTLTTTFLSRMPTLRDLLHVSPSGLAMLILSGAVGSLVALMVVGWANARFGSRALLWWMSFGYLVSMTCVGIGAELHSKPMFAIAYFVTSLTFALSNVPVNAEAAEVERHAGRSIMPQFHAGFSVGMGLGLAIGAAASHLGIGVGWHYALVALAATLARLLVIARAVLDGRAHDASAPALGGPFATAGKEYKDKRVLLIGLIVFAAAMTEMIAAQWLSIAVVDDFDRNEAVGDIIYWCFVAAMFSVRVAGASVIGRLGRVVTLRVSALFALVGVGLFAFTPTFWLVPLAVMLWGAGAALNYPIGFSAAADDPRRAAARVAAVSSFSTVAGLLIPQIVGRLADFTDMRHAMLLVIIGSVTSFMLARAVRGNSKPFRSRRREARKVGQARIAAAAAEPGPVTLDT